MRFTGKVALVTGAASGIGRATAERLAAEGAEILVADRDIEALNAAFDDDPAVTATQVDVTDSAQVNRAYDLVEQTYGRLDIVVNAAGVSDSPRRLAAMANNDIVGITDEDFAFVTEVNLYGTFYSVRAAVALMRKNSPAGGSIVNISSVGALAPFPLPVPYPSSKAGVLGLTRAVAALVGTDNIRVNAVAPGATDTAMFPTDPAARELLANLGVLRRIASPAEMANTIVYLASDEAAFITGQTISPNGGYVMA